ncbi:hypothetical protein AK88_05483 [Plasmodium fragile]|uniref:Schizont-infected cell agglutination C-terminal domain-containing protein n=1 Tax=Plasmodium fragile TaxID=5857 RepID=A0A0D9QD24_PLAFR|nr:uncharacterized protein AK88_05483 [Plasmodium fragile]KJP84884.1 hypothetical protein AK88_05483 [Plasmodium fragile]
MMCEAAQAGQEADGHIWTAADMGICELTLTALHFKHGIQLDGTPMSQEGMDEHKKKIHNYMRCILVNIFMKNIMGMKCLQGRGGQFAFGLAKGLINDVQEADVGNIACEQHDAGKGGDAQGKSAKDRDLWDIMQRWNDRNKMKIGHGDIGVLGKDCKVDRTGQAGVNDLKKTVKEAVGKVGKEIEEKVDTITGTMGECTGQGPQCLKKLLQDEKRKEQHQQKAKDQQEQRAPAPRPPRPPRLSRPAEEAKSSPGRGRTGSSPVDQPGANAAKAAPATPPGKGGHEVAPKPVEPKPLPKTRPSPSKGEDCPWKSILEEKRKVVHVLGPRSKDELEIMKKVLHDFIDHMEKHEKDMDAIGANCDNSGWNDIDKENVYYKDQTVADMMRCRLMSGALFFANQDGPAGKHKALYERLRCEVVNAFGHALERKYCEHKTKWKRGVKYAWKTVTAMGGPGGVTSGGPVMQDIYTECGYNIQGAIVRVVNGDMANLLIHEGKIMDTIGELQREVECSQDWQEYKAGKDRKDGSGKVDEEQIPEVKQMEKDIVEKTQAAIQEVTAKIDEEIEKKKSEQDKAATEKKTDKDASSKTSGTEKGSELSQGPKGTEAPSSSPTQPWSSPGSPTTVLRSDDTTGEPTRPPASVGPQAEPSLPQSPPVPQSPSASGKAETSEPGKRGKCEEFGNDYDKITACLEDQDQPTGPNPVTKLEDEYDSGKWGLYGSTGSTTISIGTSTTTQNVPTGDTTATDTEHRHRARSGTVTAAAAPQDPAAARPVDPGTGGPAASVEPTTEPGATVTDVTSTEVSTQPDAKGGGEETGGIPGTQAPEKGSAQASASPVVPAHVHNIPPPQADTGWGGFYPWDTTDEGVKPKTQDAATSRYSSYSLSSFGCTDAPDSDGYTSCDLRISFDNSQGTRNPGGSFVPPAGQDATLNDENKNLMNDPPQHGGSTPPELTNTVLTATTPVVFFLTSVTVAHLGYSLWKYFAYLGKKRRRTYRTVRDVPSPPLDEEILDHLQRDAPPPPAYGYTMVTQPASTCGRGRPPRVNRRTIIELHLEVLNERESAEWDNVKDDYLQIVVQEFAQEFAQDLMRDKDTNNNILGVPTSKQGLSGNHVSFTMDPPTDTAVTDRCRPNADDPDPWTCMETAPLETDTSPRNAHNPDPWSRMETIQLPTDPCPPNEADPDPWSIMEHIQFAADPCPPNEDDPDPWSCMETIQLATDPCAPHAHDPDPWSCMETIQLDTQRDPYSSPRTECATSECTHWIPWIDRNKHLLQDCMTQPWFLQLKADWKQYYQQHATDDVSGNSEHCEHGNIQSADMTKLRLWKEWVAQQHRQMSMYKAEWFQHLLNNVGEEQTQEKGSQREQTLHVSNIPTAQERATHAAAEPLAPENIPLTKVKEPEQQHDHHPQLRHTEQLTAHKLWMLLLAFVIEECELERSLQEKELHVDELLERL